MKAAWVCLVMIGDRYVPGALVLAQSLFETDTKYDTVCMVTPDVTPAARKALAVVFTKVVQVPFITGQKLPQCSSAKQQRMYGKWIVHSFTKWNILDARIFVEYDKVCLVDADMVFIRNCDHIMDLPVPAMTFSTPWAKPYSVNGGIPNYYLDAITGTELGHGDPVPLQSIQRARVDGFVCKGSMVLVRPDSAVFETILDLLDAGLQPSKCASGFDEQVLVDAYIKHEATMYNIHQQYNWVVSKDTWLVPPGVGNKKQPPVTPSVYQWYGIKKPWELNETLWPDLLVWHGVARNAVRCHPDLSEYITPTK